MRRSRLLVIAVVALAMTSLVGCSAVADYLAERLTAGNRQPTLTTPADLAVGDCFGDPGEEYAGYTLIPCDEAHTYEVFAEFDLTGDKFPGYDAVESAAVLGCDDAFRDFVGVNVEDSAVTYRYHSPDVGSWITADDRAVTCFAEREGLQTIGTLRGSDPRSLAAGDCFDDVLDANDPEAIEELVYSVSRADCDAWHDYEVYAVFDIDDDTATSTLESAVDERCAEAFTDFVGAAPADSSLLYGYFYPSVTSWGAGDRSVTCYVMAQQQVIGTLKDAERFTADS